jgi:hypothetical protein
MWAHCIDIGLYYNFKRTSLMMLTIEQIDFIETPREELNKFFRTVLKYILF